MMHLQCTLRVNSRVKVRKMICCLEDAAQRPRESPTWADGLPVSSRGSWHPTLLVSILGVSHLRLDWDDHSLCGGT
jgi:hypothetical protein